MNTLDIPMDENDAEAATVRDYLKHLLLEVWRQEESFSGKRPFGNSGWQFEVYAALIKAGAIPGKIDEYGCVEECDRDHADQAIFAAISGMK